MKNIPLYFAIALLLAITAMVIVIFLRFEVVRLEFWLSATYIALIVYLAFLPEHLAKL